MQPEALSLDAHMRAVVREALGDVLRDALAPIVADLAALKKAAPPAWLPLDEWARAQGVPVSTARRWAIAEIIPARKFGRQWRVDAAGTRPPDQDEIASLAARARAK